MKRNFIFVLLIALSVNIPAFADKTADADVYWIKEDFSEFDMPGNWVTEETSYPTYPNDIDVTTIYANVEAAEYCAASGGNTKAVRVRGLKDLGSFQFTVPDASKVIIEVTGKSTGKDRTVLIYRNDELVETFENLDRTVCEVFEDKINSNTELTYKITAGNIDSTDPVVIISVTVVKYGKVESEPEPEPEPDYSKYWIYDDFSEMPVTPWEIGVVHTPLAPNDIEIERRYSNFEGIDGSCNHGKKSGNLLRIGGQREGDEAGYMEFTVPDAGKIYIALKAKGTTADRVAEVTVNGSEPFVFEGLNRDVCAEFEEVLNTPEPVTIKIIGYALSDVTSPVCVNSIIVTKYESSVGINNNTTAEAKLAAYCAKDVLYVTNIAEGVTQVNIYNLQGALLSSTKLNRQTEVSIPVSSLAQGIYFVKAGSETAKIQK